MIDSVMLDAPWDCTSTDASVLILDDIMSNLVLSDVSGGETPTDYGSFEGHTQIDLPTAATYFTDFQYCLEEVVSMATCEDLHPCHKEFWVMTMELCGHRYDTDKIKRNERFQVHKCEDVKFWLKKGLPHHESQEFSDLCKELDEKIEDAKRKL
jgi:hypothetical protein